MPTLQVASIPSNQRATGIDCVGVVPWGTHFCQFYRSADDLLDVLVPYFVTGLQQNEQCLWIAADPLRAVAAREALRAALPSFDAAAARRQIEILDHEEWYLRQGEVRRDGVLARWIDRERSALEQGFEGLRVTGNTYFLERRDWSSFVEYETRVHAAFQRRRILALCSYSLDKCTSIDLIDVLRSHRFAIVSHERRPRVVHSAVALLAQIERHENGARVPKPSRPHLELRPNSRGIAEGHDVRFYDEEGFPADAVAEFLTDALRTGGAAIALVLFEHRALLRDAIERGGVDIAAAIDGGQLIMLDAREMLGALLVDGELRQERFDAEISGRMEELCAKFSTVSAFGEMVEVLSSAGRQTAAVDLEVMWNALRLRTPFRLLCAYGLGAFADASSLDAFAEVCTEHGRVQPASSHGLDAGVDQERLLSHFEQRTCALETEIHYRRQLEAERARLLDSERDAAASAAVAQRHLTELQRVTSALSEAATTIDIGRVVGTVMCNAVGAVHGTLAVDRDGVELDLLPPEPGGIDGSAPVAVAFRTGSPLWLAEPPVVAIPIVMGASCYGAVAFDFADGHELTTADRALIVDIVRQLALALDRARVYETAKAAKEQAEDANRAKDEFLAMLGHELRNPLSPILTAVELMRLRAGDVAVKERSIIARQVQHMVRLIDDLLDVSRITRGTIDLSRQPIELGEVIGRAIEMASPMFEERAHRLTTSVSARGLLVEVDPHRISQVVANLLTNAAKYTPSGGTITLTAERVGSRVRIAVRDNGLGIDPSMLSQIFDVFVQGRQALDRAGGGLGLGLCIVRRLVELHGGSVTAYSEGSGRGSTFTIDLPLAGAPATSKELHHRVGFTLSANRIVPLVARRILVVDDNHDAATLLSEALEVLGHQTRVAHDGPSAIAVAREFRPEVALVDIGLPVMDGYELAQHLAFCSKGAPPVLIALTGYGQPADRARARAAGFDDHLVKPVDLDGLSRVLERFPSPGAPALLEG